MKKIFLLPTIVILIGLVELLLRNMPLQRKILLLVFVVPASMAAAALAAYVAQVVSRRNREQQLYRGTIKQSGVVRITAAGRDYVDSPAYEMQMAAAVAQFWVPEKEFYELLLNMTASCLSESDPAKAGVTAFHQFIADNLPVIRAAIDRVKISQPAINLSEENWERHNSEIHG
jgi:hypothetical protein